jgi:uncharacterized protein (DUF697 family)
LSIGPLSLLPVVRELRGGPKAERGPVVVAGARQLVPVLARELRAGGEPGAVREGGSPASASALIWIGPADEDALRAAARARVPIVGLTEGESLPYVLDTDLIRLPGGRGFPVDAIARVLARQLGERAAGLAARLPLLREPVIDELIRSAARKNGLVAAAVFVPGVDLPVLTMNQIRLVLGIARCHGQEVDSRRLPEVLGVVGAGFGLRTVARELLDVVPVAGWAAKGAVAYAGTRAIGEAARRYFAGTRPVVGPSGPGPTLSP